LTCDKAKLVKALNPRLRLPDHTANGGSGAFYAPFGVVAVGLTLLLGQIKARSSFSTLADDGSGGGGRARTLGNLPNNRLCRLAALAGPVNASELKMCRYGAWGRHRESRLSGFMEGEALRAITTAWC
jgi:hypothetical protein